MRSLSDAAGKAGGGARSAAALFLLAAAIAIAARAAGIGDIVAHADEQYYLLVGDRMLNWGAVPYVDLWDRKPVGLFLLYAGIRLLGGDGIVQYQIVALMAVALTGGIMAVWIARFSGWPGAIAGVMLYNGLLVSHLGFGGQAEVFLNLPIVAAGWLVHGLVVGKPRSFSGSVWPQSRNGSGKAGGSGTCASFALTGTAAMVLCGLAIQIKPTAVLPGLFLGLASLWAAWRASAEWRSLLGLALLWAGAALLPTALVVACYAWHGQLDQWLFANILSIFEKAPDRAAAVEGRIGYTLKTFGLPFVLAAVIAIGQWLVRRERRLGASTLFLLGWLASGVAAFAVLSAAYPHYALVMAPMGCLLVGYAARSNLVGWVVLAGALYLSLGKMDGYAQRLQSNARIAPQLRHMAAAIAPYVNERRCLYVYHGPVILYTLTSACIPTRYAFPNHLSIRTEATGLGTDTRDEVRRILASRPAVIVDGSYGFHQPNMRSWPLVQAAIRQDYRPVAELRDAKGHWLATAYAR